MGFATGRQRFVVLTAIGLLFLIFTLLGTTHPPTRDALKAGGNKAGTWFHSVTEGGKPESNLDPPPPPSEAEVIPSRPPPDPNVDIFPLAKHGKIPAINPLNVAPNGAASTPLFIGFTRNWFLLQQAVVSYVTAGWPADQIYVVDNSGVMDSNELGLLTPANPYYLNHKRLELLGVKIIRTPTLLTFAQLQNYFINYAVSEKWSHFFWSHMDVVALSEEAIDPYKPFYNRVLECLDDVKNDPMWALRFFAYDWLTLVNVQRMKEVGGWDTQIPFYKTDCDMYERLHQRNLTDSSCRAGFIYDVASYLPDLGDLFPVPGEEPALNSERFIQLVAKLDRMQIEKYDSKIGRNIWQDVQVGGKGEPFYRHPQGFQRAIDFWIEKGQELFTLKWGYPDCDIIAHDRVAGDEWLWKNTDTKWDYTKPKGEQ